MRLRLKIVCSGQLSMSAFKSPRCAVVQYGVCLAGSPAAVTDFILKFSAELSYSLAVFRQIKYRIVAEAIFPPGFQRYETLAFPIN